MGKYAIIENNKVVNIAEAEADFAESQGWIDGTNLFIGMELDQNNEWVFPVVNKVVPEVVFMRQARLALLEVGLLDDVQVAIDSLAEPERSFIKIEWEYATEVRRDWPTLLQLTSALGLTENQIDDLFILASSK